MVDKVKDIITKGAEIASPIPLPTKENKKKVKKIIRKTDKFLQDKFPEATKKLIEFDKKLKEESDKFNEKADVYMEKNFPKTKKFIEKGIKKIKPSLLQRTSNSTGGRIGYKSGMGVCKLAKRGKGRAYGKNS